MEPLDTSDSNKNAEVQISCTCGSHKICEIIKNGNHDSDNGPVIMKNNKILKLYGFYLTSLPSCCSTWNTITHLSVGIKLENLEIFPPNLQSLYCDDNNIVSIKNIPKSLIHLSIQNNQLSVLDLSYTQVVECYCNNNCLKSIIGSNKLKNLSAQNNKDVKTVLQSPIEKLNLSGCNIKKINQSIIYMDDKHKQELKYVNMINNFIKDIDWFPEGIEYLYLTNNRIRSVDSLKIKLPNLITLHISSNNLVKIENLPSSLNELLCSSNSIEQIILNINNLSITFNDNPVKLLILGGENIQFPNMTFHNWNNLMIIPSDYPNIRMSDKLTEESVNFEQLCSRYSLEPTHFFIEL